jgi:hypothetical protein
MKIDISNLQQFSLGDAEDFEEYARLPFLSLPGMMKPGPNGTVEMNLPVRALVALVWIVGRRQDRTLTVEQVRNMDFRELEFVGADGQRGNLEELPGGEPVESRA